jgi:uncharacterized protein YceK
MLKIEQTRDHCMRALFIGWMMLLLSACSSLIPHQTSFETASVTETQAITISPTEGDVTQMAPALLTPADPGMQDLIEKTKEDLAQRLSISLTQVSLVEAAEVEWSDSSLGCPQPGMDYLQVITPGYRILLEVNAQTYEYHSNRNTYFILCENSSPPSFPKP